MKALTIMTLVFAATAAQADGFVCKTADGELKVAVYNQTQPEAGTRNAATMILSNPTLQTGNKTIAKFTSEEGNLVGESTFSGVAMYTANVDLRFANSNREGEYLLGTRLGSVDKVVLEVEFSYENPVEDSAELDGIVSVEKRNGDSTSAPVVCKRHLKGM